MKVRRPLKADQRAALESLAEQVGPRLLAYVRQVYGRRVDAEDIVAETFCRAADNAEALMRADRCDLYLLTITRNLCRDGFRRRRAQAVGQGRLRGRPAGAPSPPGAASGRESQERLRQAVAGLPRALREVVVLRLSTEMKFEQIAELLDVPLGTALSRMHAALRRLRRELGGFDER